MNQGGNQWPTCQGPGPNLASHLINGINELITQAIALIRVVINDSEKFCLSLATEEHLHRRSRSLNLAMTSSAG